MSHININKPHNSNQDSSTLLHSTIAPHYPPPSNPRSAQTPHSTSPNNQPSASHHFVPSPSSSKQDCHASILPPRWGRSGREVGSRLHRARGGGDNIHSS